MLTDREQNELIQPIIDIYNDMELELFKEIALRLSTYDGVSGSLKWYLDKINDMGILNDEAIKIIAKYSSLSEQAIREILENAQYNIFDINVLDEAFKRNIIPISPIDLMANKVFETTLLDSYKEAASAFKLIQTKALESTQQRYMDVLNRAYIETSTGTYSYSQSISKAVKEMAKKGITGATYKRKDGAIVNYSIEAAVRRDILTATNKTCNESEMRKIELLKAKYVEVSSHIGARVSDKNPIADHAGWQGKVYKLKGSEKDYPNFYEKTGYGDILGLGGVNCRHHFDAFFPGISTPAALKYDYEENKKYYEATQKQRKMERDIRYLKKQKIAFEQLGDNDEVQRVNRELRAKSKQLNEFCDKNNLRRDRSRENVVASLDPKNIAEAKAKKEQWIKKDELLLENSDKLDIPTFIQKRKPVNSSEVVDEMIKCLDIQTDDKRIIDIIKNDISLMPVKDLDYIKNNKISVLQSSEHAKGGFRVKKQKFFWKNDIIKEIEINPKKARYGTFAHEFAHYVAYDLDIYNNDEFIKIITNAVKNAKVVPGDVNGETYAVIISDVFVNEYQGRTYIKYDDLLKGKKIEYKDLYEYISVGYQTFVMNPNLLYLKDQKLYDFFEGGWITNEK